MMVKRGGGNKLDLASGGCGVICKASSSYAVLSRKL